MSACGTTSEDGLVCERKAGNHPRCTGYDDEADDFVDWPNPNYIESNVHADPAKARETKAEAMARTAPDRRVGAPTGFEAGVEASERSAERWTADEKALVTNAVQDVCREHAFRAGGSEGHDEFTADDIWDKLAGSVPVTKGLTAILRVAQGKGWCDTTGKTAISRRGGNHDHGQRLSVWYSLMKGA